MIYCKQCILPESYPGISFDEQGVCNYCREYVPDKERLGKEKLIEVLNSKYKHGKYDCVVPLSGGKDSSYILYYIVKVLGLNPLVVSYNSGYQHKIAQENVRNACRLLNVHLEEIKSPGNIQTNLLKTSYKLSQLTGLNWGCANCSAILRSAPIRLAKKYKVPFVIWGSSILEVVNKGQQTKDQFSKIKLVLRHPSVIYYGSKYIYLRILQRLLLKFPIQYALNPYSIEPFSSENPKFIHFYDYVNWDSMKNVNILKNEIGWRHPNEKDSRFDCTLHSIANVYYIKNFGISHDGISMCNMIRNGKINRDEAVNREHDVENYSYAEYNAVLDRLN